MSLDELEQALAASKWKGAEKNIKEILTKMFEAPPELVERIVFAWEKARNHPLMLGRDTDMRDGLVEALADGPDIPEEVQEAIEANVSRGIRRAALRWRMEHKMQVFVPFKKLVPDNDLLKMCDGCVRRMECVEKNLSNPRACREGHRVYPDPDERHYFQYVATAVTVVKLDGDTVTVKADHPQGTYRLSILDFSV